MSSLILTIRESVRYRGKSGHYSWIAHRLSGLAILGFLVLHSWDTANAHFYPELYAWSLVLFKHPIFAIGEIGVMAAVLYHAFNGIRITILDFKPEWWMHQKKSATIVWVLFAVIFIPIGAYMLIEFLGRCSELGAACWAFPRLSDFIG
ncbi:MAG: succinate dehydrogenase, cytochrome b556 subunit [Anaerolineales bacterium]|nr:succinate dehydrogenase, cytochrome b556 subunit [Anaerolineales bacterium]MCB8940673.1 succinate dehydrogenase, cytochrome b556 subunit [Ardenticatenaceae bacterium]